MVTLKLTNAEALALQSAVVMGADDMSVGVEEQRFTRSEIAHVLAAAAKLNDAVRHLHKSDTAPEQCPDGVDSEWYEKFSAALWRGVDK